MLLLNQDKTDNQTVEFNPDELGFNKKVLIKDIYSDEDYVGRKRLISKDLSAFSFTNNIFVYWPL